MTPAYLLARRGMKARPPAGPRGFPWCGESQSDRCFLLYSCLYCLTLYNGHVLFIEPGAHGSCFHRKVERRSSMSWYRDLAAEKASRPPPWWPRRTRALGLLAPLPAAPPCVWRKSPQAPAPSLLPREEPRARPPSAAVMFTCVLFESF